jgi:hypothetical protein
MDATRIISLRQFDRVRQRFSNVAFKHSTGERPDTPDRRAGISVFDTSCACPELGGDCVCAHIARFYGDVFQEPCAYWRFDTEILVPPNPNPDRIPQPSLIKVPSTSGDECHFNIHLVSNERAKKLFYENCYPPEQRLWLCHQGRSEQYSLHRVLQLLDTYKLDA